MTDTNQATQPAAPKAAPVKPATKAAPASEFEHQRSKTDERAKFLAKRQAKLDAAEDEGGADGSERGTVKSQFDNPPSVRATDGGAPGTKPRNPLEVAAEADEKAE